MNEKKSQEIQKDPLIKKEEVSRPTSSGRPDPEKLSWKWSALVLVFFFATFAWFVHIILFSVTTSATNGRQSTYAEMRGDRNYRKWASKILRENPLIDGHNDLAILIRQTYNNEIYKSNFTKLWRKGGLSGQVDVPRIEKGHYGGAFWSAFMVCPLDPMDFSDETYGPIVQATLGQLDLYHRLALEYPKYFSPASTAAHAREVFAKGDFIAPFIIEGLHQIGNSLSTLRLYHQLGVRYATLTWNCHNIYADAACITDFRHGAETKPSKPLHHGLSENGIILVEEMNRLGMMVDLAHVSVETMIDVLSGKDGWKGSIAPPIFSHSSAFAICPHPRNVPDHVLQLVKERKSVVMVNFNPEFISCTAADDPENEMPTYEPKNNTLHQVVRHIMHIGKLIGYDHVGIGSDYDGIESTPAGLEDVSKMPYLFAELLKAGISEEDCAKIAGGNVLRVWQEVDDVAADLRQKGVKPAEDKPVAPFPLPSGLLLSQVA